RGRSWRAPEAHEEPEPRSFERGVGNLAHADQYDAVTGLFADRSIRADEFGLAVGETQRLGARDDVPMKPIARRVGADNRNAVPVIQELAQPGQVLVPRSERRVHECQPAPRLTQSIVIDGKDSTCRYDAIGGSQARMRRVEIEGEPKPVEYRRRRVPVR